MKKNKMMRLASSLMVAVLLTTSVISGTFAKYVTESSADDNARVAKFGVVIQADGALYGDKYKTGQFSVPTTEADIAQLSVKSYNDGNVVAPGTKSDSGLNFSINGQPEVRTQLDVTIKAQNIYLTEGEYGVMVAAPTVTETSYEADVYYICQDATAERKTYELSTAATFDPNAEYYTLEDIVDLSKDYYPVVYAADKTDGTIDEDSLNAIAFDYAQKLGYTGALDTEAVTADGELVYEYTFSAEYDPNFNYADLEVANDALTWKWEFEQAAGTDMYNGADTILGNLMAGEANGTVVKVDAGGNYTEPEAISSVDMGDYCLDTSFEIDITVTQVD